jgi:hypothetical protein
MSFILEGRQADVRNKVGSRVEVLGTLITQEAAGIAPRQGQSSQGAGKASPTGSTGSGNSLPGSTPATSTIEGPHVLVNSIRTLPGDCTSTK